MWVSSNDSFLLIRCGVKGENKLCCINICSLLCPERVPIAGVGFCPSRQPAHQGGVTPSGGVFGEILPPGPFHGRHCGNPVARDHPPSHQSGGDGDS